MTYSLTVKHATTPELMKTLSQVAVDNRLYVPGWIMKDEFDSVLEDSIKNGVRSVSVMYLEGTPIGAAVTRKSGYMHLFVKKDFRRTGYGTILAKSTAKKNRDLTLKYAIGTKGSPVFFSKCGVNWFGSTETI